MELIRAIPNDPIGVVFDLSYSEKELYPACCPINIALWNQRKHAELLPPRYRYRLYDLTMPSYESQYFMSLYCDILREKITTIKELEVFFTWMSTIVMSGFLQDATTTVALWHSTLPLTYKKPDVKFTPSLRESHQQFLVEYLEDMGQTIRRKTIKQFVVIPV